MNPELEQLKRQVQELMDWKNQRERQQLSYPLDETSREIIQENLWVIEGEGVFERASGDIGAYFVEVKNKKNNTNQIIGIYPPLTLYTADPGTDTLTALNHGFSNDERVVLVSTGLFPGGLSDTAPYFIINATANTFQLSTTLGGSAVNITNAGTPNNFVYYF